MGKDFGNAGAAGVALAGLEGRCLHRLMRLTSRPANSGWAETPDRYAALTCRSARAGLGTPRVTRLRFEGTENCPEGGLAVHRLPDCPRMGEAGDRIAAWESTNVLENP